MGSVIFFRHMVQQMARILKKHPSIGRYRILNAYLRLKLRQILIMKVLRSKLHSAKLFGRPITFFDCHTFLYLFEEVFTKEEYCFLSTKDDPFIIDCGSNIGLSLVYFKSIYPNSKILAFEPDPRTFGLLQKNVASQEMTHVETINSAVHDTEGSIAFYFDPSEPGSPRQSIQAGRISSASETVPAVLLSKYINREVDFLKMDIEGAELVVIEELVRHDKLVFIREMVIEYHHHIEPSDDRLSKLLAMLESSGFGYQLSTGLETPFRPDVFQDVLVYAYRRGIL